MCVFTTCLGFLTARWPQIGLLTWRLRALGAGTLVSKMQAQLWNLCRITSTALNWFHASGYRFQGWDRGPVSQWGWVLRPHCRRACEMRAVAGVFGKCLPCFLIWKIFHNSGNFWKLFNTIFPPRFPFGTPNIQMFDRLYWCSNFHFSSIFIIFILLCYFPKISVLSPL